MKISENTLSILKSFSKISEKMVITPGSTIRISQEAHEVLAQAEVDEEFDEKIGIGDLRQFLAIIGELGLESDVEFGKTSLVVSNGENKVTLRYASPDVIAHKDKSPNVPDFVANLQMTREQMDNIKKFASILKVKHVAFIGSDSDPNTIRVSLQNSETPENKYEIDIPCENEHGDFEAAIKVEHIQFIPGPYKVNISKHSVLHFEIQDGTNVQYWVVCEAQHTEFGEDENE